MNPGAILYAISLRLNVVVCANVCALFACFSVLLQCELLLHRKLRRGVWGGVGGV